MSEKLTKIELLLGWLALMKHSGRKYVRTSEIIRWGLENYSISAERNARHLAENSSFIKRIKPHKIKEKYGINTREWFYEFKT